MTACRRHAGPLQFAVHCHDAASPGYPVLTAASPGAGAAGLVVELILTAISLQPYPVLHLYKGATGCCPYGSWPPQHMSLHSQEARGQESCQLSWAILASPRLAIPLSVALETAAPAPGFLRPRQGNYVDRAPSVTASLSLRDTSHCDSTLRSISRDQVPYILQALPPSNSSFAQRQCDCSGSVKSILSQGTR